MGQIARLAVYVDEDPSATIAVNDAGAYVAVARLEERARKYSVR